MNVGRFTTEKNVCIFTAITGYTFYSLKNHNTMEIWYLRLFL